MEPGAPAASLSELAQSIIEHEQLSDEDLLATMNLYLTGLIMSENPEDAEKERRQHYQVCKDALFRFYTKDRDAYALVVLRVKKTLKRTRETVDADMEILAKAQRQTGHAPRPSAAPGDQYKEREDEIVWEKASPLGPVAVSLCNFTARITSGRREDDGAEIRYFFEITLRKGSRRVTVAVAAEKFPGMNWPLDALGPAAILAAGQGNKDHLRAAIQWLSGEVPERRIYKHIGWREINGRWCYLHAGGALGPDGMEPNIEVSVDPALERYVLPPPPQGKQRVQAIRASLRLLQVMPKQIGFSTYAEVWRAPLGHVDSSGFLHGRTGTGKSEWASLLQRHFGSRMDRLNLPANFFSTGNSLEYLAFLAKDALLVVDDFYPTGSPADVQRYHKEAERIFRTQGNRSGRGRLTRGATLQLVKPPRGLVLGTGEEAPQGQSLQARICVLKVADGDMNWTRLTACQRDAEAGLFAQAMAAYLQWLAPRYAEITAGLKKEIATFRANALQGAHRRTPEIVANLAVGLKYFLQFTVEAKALSHAKMKKLWRAAWKALQEMAQAQGRLLEDRDPIRRFITLLVSAVASGEAHMASLEGDAPREPARWGWREVTVGTGEYERVDWRPQGKRVGWVSLEEELYLGPDAAFAVAQTLSSRQNEALPVSLQTLKLRLKEDGYLASWEDKRQRTTVRRTIEGKVMEVLHILLQAFTLGYTPPRGRLSRPSHQAKFSREARETDEQPSRPSNYRPKETQEKSIPYDVNGRCGRSENEAKRPSVRAKPAQERAAGFDRQNGRCDCSDQTDNRPNGPAPSDHMAGEERTAIQREGAPTGDNGVDFVVEDFS